MKALYQRFIGLFRKKPKPANLQEALKLVSKVLDDFDDASAYIYGTRWDREILGHGSSMIPGHKPCEAEIDFLKKASFALSSYRDEIMIAVNNQKRKPK